MQLAIERVTKHYGRKSWALRDFSFRLDPGVVGLLGPNGAGKSTLMRILATVSTPTEGRVTWNGVDISARPEAVRSILGYLPQDFGVYPHLTPVEFLGYLAAAKGLPLARTRQRVDALLDLVNLSEVRDQPVGGFSGGMRQRVGIAQALLNDPQLLIVDEPTAGLDPEERIRFRDLLTTLSGERIVLLSTHIVSDVEAVAASIALIAGGQLIRHGTPESLLRDLDGRVWEMIVTSDQVEATRGRWLVTGTVRRSDGVHVRIVSSEPPSRDSRPLPPTLEDVYLESIGAHREAARA
ncbi:MAG: ABC transporter ATP-binding protein [Acidobacteriota bacterium]